MSESIPPEQPPAPEVAAVVPAWEPIAPLPPAAPALNLWPSAVVLLMAFGGTVAGSMLALVLAVAMGGSLDVLRDVNALIANPVFLITSLLTTQLSMLLAVRVLPRLLKDQPEGTWTARMRWDPSRFSVIDLVLTTLGTLATGTVASGVMALTPLESKTLEAMESAARDLSPGVFGLFLFSGSVGAGFVEELTFRGMLQTRLVQRRGPTVGIFITAAVFGAWHFDLVHSPIAMMLGLWLGWCAHRQKTIVTVALAHLLNNFTSFVLSRATTGDTDPPPLYGIVGGAIVLAVCAALMHVRRPPESAQPSS